MNIQDRKKTLTVEELRRRYNLDGLEKDRKAIQVSKEEIINTNKTLNDFVETTTQNLEDLQNQVDGNITTWFYSGVPTLLNTPAVDWTTDTDKDKHLGDLYYDQATGYAYRFQKSNNVYSWLKLTDSDVTEALAIANAAKDTADSKRRVFVSQPTPPYDIGDIWIKDDEDLYRCKTATQEGGSYSSSHWILATNYTDDTVATQALQELNQFKTDVQETYATNVELITTANSINGRVDETYTYVNTVETQLQDLTTTQATINGTNTILINDALESNALGYSVDGATEQDSYSGKNKLDTTLLVNGSSNGITLTQNNDGTITLNGTATANSLFTATLDNSINNNGYNFQINKKSGTIQSGNLQFFLYTTGYSNNQNVALTPNINSINTTLNSNEYTIERIVIPSGSILDNVVIEAFVQQDNIFERYVGGTASPNPNYPQEIKIIPSGIDLLNVNNSIRASIPTNSTAENLSTDTSAITSEWIECLPNTNYYLNGNYNRQRWQLKDDNGIITYAEGKYITTSSNTKYFRCYYYYSNSGAINPSSITNVQILTKRYTKVKVTGKNLIDDSLEQNGYTVAGNGLLAYDSSYVNNRFASEQYIKVYNGMILNSNYKIVNYALYDNNKQFISRTNNILQKTITMTADGYIRIGFIDVNSDTLAGKLMLYENEETTIYEAYKENNAFIDLAKENLFDSALEIGDIDTSTGEDLTYSGVAFSRTIGKTNVLSNTEYTISTNKSTNQIVVYYYDESDNYLSFINTQNNFSISSYTFTTPNNCKKIRFRFKTTDTTISVNLFESNNPTPYYELCKIGNYKDTLTVNSNGNVVITKNIGKVVLNGSETGWSYNSSSNMPFRYLIPVNVVQTTSSDEVPKIISDYYTTYAWNNTPSSNYGITLGRQTNVVAIRNTDITSLSNFKTWLSTHNTDVYYVLATPETITLSNTTIPLYEGINHISLIENLETDTAIKYYRKTPLSNIETQINEIKNTVDTNQTATQLKIDVINEQLINGVTKFSTGTGYTFDIEGLKIKKTDSIMNSILDNDGLRVFRNEDKVLEVNSDGVNAENMTVRKFYVQRPLRVEKTHAISDSTKAGLGIFWVGE